MVCALRLRCIVDSKFSRWRRRSRNCAGYMLYFSIDTVLSLDRFSPQMSPPYVPSVSVYRVDCVSMMTPMTPYFNYKIGVRRKERGLKLCCPSPDYRRFVNMYEFHILKSFYDPKKICDNMCLYVLTQSLNK